MGDLARELREFKLEDHGKDDSTLTSYREGYAAGLEAAAKVCDDLAGRQSQDHFREMCEWCADEIRALAATDQEEG